MNKQELNDIMDKRIDSITSTINGLCKKMVERLIHKDDFTKEECTYVITDIMRKALDEYDKNYSKGFNNGKDYARNEKKKSRFTVIRSDSNKE